MLRALFIHKLEQLREELLRTLLKIDADLKNPRKKTLKRELRRRLEKKRKELPARLEHVEYMINRLRSL